ncbi:MAG: DNA topoisomerase III [Acetivibrio ethanolgignens]
MKALVIAEKPSVGRDIARVLKCGNNKNGVLEGEKYVVTWAMGHLVELADPEGYDNKYKEWKLTDLPIVPEKWKYEVLRQTGKQFNIVKAQLARTDIKEVVIATDAGREGELVARLILLKTGCKKPIKRLWISSVTDKAIREGFAHLKNGHDYDNLYAAALCRAEADWLVGINATRALTCKYNAQLSCGRVQTPTLAMIAKREEEIKSFVPKSYYGLEAQAKGLKLVWQDKKSGSKSSFDREGIEALRKALEGKNAVITAVEKQSKKNYAPLLYDLTELQRDANRRFGLSAKETLNIMQRLYENHKVLTYPRTDSRYVSSDIVDTIPERLRACSVGPYRKLAGRLVNTSFSRKAAFVNDAKVSDHHAIIPTEQYVQLDHMTNEERKIYDLVVRRFLAVLYPPYEYEETKLTADIGGETFTAKGQAVKSLGWKEVYEAGDASEEMWIEEDEKEADGGYFKEDLEKGSIISNLVIRQSEGKTKPPAPFNEATLLSAMENPVKYMESRDKEQIKTLGETGGLGTVATRADIIEKLFHSFLIEKKGKDIFITSKAKQLLELVPEDLKKPELTADWEMKLSKIAKGELRRDTFMDSIRNYTDELIGEIKTGEGTFRHDNLTNKKCPNCGKRLLAVNGKNSRLLVCQDRECGYRETIARTSNARCPVCHKKMELMGQGEKQTFTCTCGYKERLSAFQERRKKEGGGVSKKDVARYMNKQRKEAKEPVNTGLAEALKNIKL